MEDVIVFGEVPLRTLDDRSIRLVEDCPFRVDALYDFRVANGQVRIGRSVGNGISGEAGAHTQHVIVEVEFGTEWWGILLCRIGDVRRVRFRNQAHGVSQVQAETHRRRSYRHASRRESDGLAANRHSNRSVCRHGRQTVNEDDAQREHGHAYQFLPACHCCNSPF